ncbi:MAG: FIST N-terminal domain-containing protein [Pirellulaceae bacterium]
MRDSTLLKRCVATLWALLLPCSVSAQETWNAPVTEVGGPIVMRVVMVKDEVEDPFAAGKEAAEALQKAMDGVALKAVILSECFEDKDNKENLLLGICSVVGQDVVFGAATYGSFTQAGCADFDSVCLLGIGGTGIGVSAGIVTEMGTAQLVIDQQQAEITRRLHAAGNAVSKQLLRSDADRLMILIPDAHSPKNRYLVEGVQQVVGRQFPMTGGSANKNAGQTHVYFRGQLYQDSVVALMLSGDFQVSLAGRLAKDQEAVIRTAGEGAAEAIAKMPTKPLAVLAYNCAGRRGKLQNVAEELTAIQQSIGTSVPLFGCYNAGEIGPLDASEKEKEKDSDALCGGSGWHVMFTVLGRD